jgi:hypothetical protein
MTDTPKKVLLDAVSLNLPLAWPPPAKGKSGSLKVETIQWDRRDFGGVQGTLQQYSDGLGMSFRHQSKLFPGMVVLVDGTITESGPEFEARLPSFELQEEMDLGRFASAAAGMMVKGRLSARTRVSMRGGEPLIQTQVTADQAALHQPEQGLHLEKMRLELTMDDLMAMNSAPKQRLQIATLRFGELEADSLDVDFQVEQGETLFIEKATVNWCQGRINTAALRIAPGVEDYDVTLFCDRLNLAMLLDQLGAAEASGDGTVNGRIPVRWTDGKLSVDNGFLYSTPGQSGAIKITGTEAMLAGLPPGTPQHTQLDIATEALKDYTYQWAKLNVSTDADDLLVTLKLDGKPNRLLPFAYDKGLGQFKRVAGQGQADFKGISIDLNFTSPLNEIIEYKALFNKN